MTGLLESPDVAANFKAMDQRTEEVFNGDPTTGIPGLQGNPGSPVLTTSPSPGAVRPEWLERYIQLLIRDHISVDYPSVAALFYTDAFEGWEAAGCTATLVAPNALLTARHCIEKCNIAISEKPPCPHRELVGAFFQHYGFVKIEKLGGADHVVLHDNSGPPVGPPVGDLALVFLESRISGILPASLNLSGAAGNYSELTSVGFGVHSNALVIDASGQPQAPARIWDPGIEAAGIKTYTKIVRAECSGDRKKQALICGHFGSAAGTGSICDGDSGGPLFARIGGAWAIVGVASTMSDCTQGDTSIFVDVSGFAKDWILPQLQLHPTPTNPDSPAAIKAGRVLSPVLNDDTRYLLLFRDEPLDQVGAWSHPVKVPADASWVRVGVDTIPMSGKGIKLVVDFGGAAAPCVQAKTATGLICDIPIAQPPNADWTVTVFGEPNQQIQVVATSF
ncbi:trypsin-like serine protease [Methylocapsa sp. S129]|uniref:S1 family peptidase n=1 Tax=Methylocapsa sp. S129 TaxID=1641869 RepID=UPI00131B2113|nr:trypsin-like serine protease [Methylocapsa sp. S129]